MVYRAVVSSPSPPRLAVSSVSAQVTSSLPLQVAPPPSAFSSATASADGATETASTDNVSTEGWNTRRMENISAN